MRIAERAERLLGEMRVRYLVDVAGMIAGVRERLSSREELRPLSIDGDLADGRGRLGVGEVRTAAWETDRLRKIVLSEVRLWPVIEGFALTLLPRQSVAAPVFGADFMLLPARLSANAEVYGARERTAGVLSPLRETFDRLDRRAGPAWTAGVASGEGLRAKVSPRLVGEASAALTGALGAYLDAVSAAPTGAPSAGPTADQATFFRLFHAHGPRHGPLRFVFGDAWAERYSRLVFE